MKDLVLTYAVTLAVAVLVSERARRTVLSTAVLFLLVGIGFGVWVRPAGDGIVRVLANLALVTVLFTDAMRMSLPRLREAWRLPGRALLLGFPLTLVGTAVAGWALVDLSWPEALLVGAALAPTDPVFASAIVGREEVPRRLRNLLSVESGLNDGLALPFVVGFIALAGHRALAALPLAGELAFGVAIGVAVPWLMARLEGTTHLGAAEQYRRIGVFAAGLLVLSLALATHANEFLAAFTAGVTLATVVPSAPAAFAEIGEAGSEIMKLAALLVFGTMLSPAFLRELPWGGWVFAVMSLFAIRPLAIAAALAGSELTVRERLVAAWFGPKGFASVVYGLLILSSGVARSDLLFHLIAITTGLSILLHSSTDVPVAHWFERSPDAAETGGRP